MLMQLTRMIIKRMRLARIMDIRSLFHLHRKEESNLDQPSRHRNEAYLKLKEDISGVFSRATCTVVGLWIRHSRIASQKRHARSMQPCQRATSRTIDLESAEGFSVHDGGRSCGRRWRGSQAVRQGSELATELSPTLASACEVAQRIQRQVRRSNMLCCRK